MLTDRPTGMRPQRKPRFRSKENVRMDLNDEGVIAKNSTYMAQNRDYWRTLVNAALNLSVP